MLRKMICLVGVISLIATGVFAGPPVMIKAAEATDAILYMYADEGDDVWDQWAIKVIASTGSMVFYNNDTAMFTLATNGAVTMVGSQVLPATAKFTTTPVANANVVEGTTNTLSGVINLLTGTGADNGATVTNTLANPSAAGQWAIIYNAAAATNLIAIQKTGNFTGTALSIAAGESAILFAPTSSTWAGIGQ